MNRRSLFAKAAGLFGALGLAKAQTCVSESYRGCIHWLTGKAKNGQCPVCGTMAPKYDPMAAFVGTELEKTQRMLLAKMGKPGPRMIRCARCSNAFYQDAE